MSLGNYIGIGSAIVIFGLTLLLLMKEYLTPWLIKRFRFRQGQAKRLPTSPKLRGVRITMGGIKGDTDLSR